MASTSPNSTPTLLTWLGIGVAAAAALYTTHRQLAIYKARCETTPKKPNNVGVEQATEDAIKLETLAQLARGVNPALRNAALKIITERAFRQDSLNYILSELHSNDAQQREMSLEAIRILSLLSPRSFYNQPVIFHTLTAYLGAIHVPSKHANVVFRILARFSDRSDCIRHMRSAGLDQWLTENTFETEKVDAAYFELKVALCDTEEAREARAQEAERMRRSAGAEFEEWVEAMGNSGVTEAEVLAGIFTAGH